MQHPVAVLKQSFLDRLAHTGLTDTAAAAAIGVTRQYFSQVKTGQAAPSVGFMVGVVGAGLAASFDEIAEVVDEQKTEAA